MKITINGASADIQLENEKTVGEILAAMEAWLAASGHRPSGLVVDGEVINAGSVDACFGREISGIETLDILTSSLSQLAAESLLCLMRDIDTWENSGFDERRAFSQQWKQSPEANLLAEQAPDVYDWAVKTFSGEGAGAAELRSVGGERLRELSDPAGELGRTKQAVTEVCDRLERLPLDLQTGKDAQAAMTVSVFSGIAEKVFRIFNVLRAEGFPVAETTVADMPIAAYMGEFGGALGEMLDAYKQHDTVLVGDLAEYEMAPRLRGLYSAICTVAGTFNAAEGE
jgi:hypothetical protein